MNVLIYRLPRGKSIVKPPSHCTSCGEYVRFFDNIPLVSWMILGGKCRFCKTSISLSYPLTEIITGFLFWVSYIKFGLGAEFALAVCLIFVTVTAGFADLYTAMDKDFECGIIPDSMIVVGLVSGFITAYLVHGNVLFPIYGTAVGFLALFIPAFLYKLIRKREGMGFGDIKLIAVCGAFLGLKSVFFLVFASALMGAIFGITIQGITGKRDIPLPFGPFIAASAIIYLFFETRMDRLLYGA